MADTDLLELEASELDDALPGNEEEIEGEQSGADDEPKEEEVDGEKPPPPTSLFQADGKKLDPAIKAGLAKLKTESPEVAKLVTRALYKSAELEREFPGGLVEAKELRDKIDGLGGVSGIEEKLADFELLDGYDKQFANGDPAFVNALAEADPAAFAKIAPVFFAKFNEVSPDGWKKYLGTIVYNDFQKNEIPVQLTRLADSLRRKDEAGAAESFNALATYLYSFKDLMDLRVEAPKGRPAENKTDDLSRRESDLRSREWQTEYAGIERRMVQDEYKTAIGSRKPTTEDKAQIQELFLSKRQTLARQYFPDQAKKLDSLRRANDKAGFMRLATMMQKRVTPEAMRWAVSRTLKPARAAQQQQQRKEPAHQQQPQNGGGMYKFVASEPGTWDIDYSYPGIKQLLGENKAVLKDGSKVQWRDRKG